MKLSKHVIYVICAYVQPVAGTSGSLVASRRIAGDGNVPHRYLLEILRDPATQGATVYSRPPRKRFQAPQQAASNLAAGPGRGGGRAVGGRTSRGRGPDVIRSDDNGIRKMKDEGGIHE